MYINDSKICFSLQGLRWIQKADHSSGHQYMIDHKEWYTITIQYKGAQTNQRYDTAEERDAVYDLAVKQLTKDDDRYKVKTVKEETVASE